MAMREVPKPLNLAVVEAARIAGNRRLLSRASGVSYPTILSIYNGTTGCRPATARKIAAAVGGLVTARQIEQASLVAKADRLIIRAENMKKSAQE